MEKNKNIPAFLMDLIENLPFSKLGKKHQDEILKYISEEEYQRMFLSCQLLKMEMETGTIPQVGELAIKPSWKEKLVPLLRYAAILVVCITGSFLAGYMLGPGHPQERNNSNQGSEKQAVHSGNQSLAEKMEESSTLSKDSLASSYIFDIYK